MFKPLSIEKRSEWAEKIRRQKESGLSASRWCREHQISQGAFSYWKDRLFPKTPMDRSLFTELRNESTTTGISIEYQKLRILIEKGFDPETFKSCLSVLGRF